ncbi:CCR4-NOT transcription complex subunit 6-like [Hondaea fermentalgiana]|uniref:CCR4-NOT transcription complex subunit 6-like n=1 Tax=Hondaea fermentalgiana TaxID=2315210 RepID=A0A2R5GJ60_9STRA|nr:CCR4-NOT transcription complex subunit 6-like [Hondaea fermentalgiana]|eukprot:GBG30655.1 CCR4-NOT transcription complex subunit 6-like [Hondaea fermentalgiana]
MDRDDRGHRDRLRRGLVVLTFNVWFENSRRGVDKNQSKEHGFGSWPERCAALQKWLHVLQPDVICLQEVLQGGGHDMLADLFGPQDASATDSTEYPYRFYARASQWWIDDKVNFGNAIVSRFPLARTRALQLPVQLTPGVKFYETRGAALAEISSPFGAVFVASLHLNHQLHQPAIRLLQTRAVTSSMQDFVNEGVNKNVLTQLLCGDFNAKPDEACIRFLRGSHPVTEPGAEDVFFQDAWSFCNGEEGGFTWSRKNPGANVDLEEDKRLDYIFASLPHRDGRGLVEDCRVVCDHPFAGDFPSDHFGVLTEIRAHPSLDTPRAKY